MKETNELLESFHFFRITNVHLHLPDHLVAMDAMEYPVVMDKAYRVAMGETD